MRSLCALLVRERHQPDDLDEQARRRIRAAQIDAVVQLVPLTMTINILNAAIVVYVFWDIGATVFLIAWAALIALAAAASLWSWSRTRQNRPTGASARATKRIVLHAAFLAAIWGAAPLVLFPDADLMGQLILACLIAGMISGGAFGLSTVPKAGLVYTWTIVLAMESAFFLAGYRVFVFAALLLLLYAVFISRHLVAHGTLFVRHLRDQLKLEAQSEVIGLLLNDFQENASDWLWETDANGILTRVSDRFADAAEKTPSEIQGALFSDVIGGQHEYRPPELLDILNRIAARTAFRDVVVPVQFGTHWRFWLLSAKPVFDNAGRFIGYRGVGADVTEKRLAEERNTYLARYDTVTGLPNRVSFQEEVDRALAEARANGQPVAMLCLDLDQFKSINDTLGHHVGDALLKQVGQRIRACARDRDIVARLGGDEFAILQLSPDLPTGTMVLARQIIDAFKAPFKLEHGDIAIDTSIGIAVAPADGWAADALMKKADMALLRRQSGRRRNLPLLRAGDGSLGAPPPCLGSRVAIGAGQRRDPGGVPAFGRPAQRHCRRLRGAGALEIARMGLRVAGRVYSGRGSNRADRADRRMGAARGRQDRAPMARGHGRRRESFPGAIQEPEIAGNRGCCLGGQRAAAASPRTGSDRVDLHRRQRQCR